MRINVAGIVKINPAKNVKIAITPLIKMAVKSVTILELIIFQKCLISIEKLFKNALKEFMSLATTLPVKCENSVSFIEAKINEISDKIIKPTIAFNILFATKI